MAFKLNGSNVRVGETDVSVLAFVRSSTSGLALTGITSSEVNCAYWRSGSTVPVSVALTAATAGLAAAHADGKWIPLSTSLTPGAVRLDLPDACWTAGADFTAVVVKNASGTAAYEIAMTFPLTWDGVVRTFTPAAFGANSITLDSGAPTAVNFAREMMVEIVKSTGAGDVGASAYVTAYSTARVATLGNGWNRTPLSTGTMTAVMYSSPPVNKWLAPELTISTGNVLTAKYQNGDTAYVGTVTRTTGLGSIVTVAVT